LVIVALPVRVLCAITTFAGGCGGRFVIRRRPSPHTPRAGTRSAYASFPRMLGTMPAIKSTKSSMASNPTISNRCPQSGKASKKPASGMTREHIGFFYTARLAEAVYVFHVFEKKTQATLKRDIDTGKERFADLMRKRK